jgi:hypothetical protein
MTVFSSDSVVSEDSKKIKSAIEKMTKKSTK